MVNCLLLINPINKYTFRQDAEKRMPEISGADVMLLQFLNCNLKKNFTFKFIFCTGNLQMKCEKLH